MIRHFTISAAMLVTTLLSACSGPTSSQNNDGDWEGYAGNEDDTRYSPLTEINETNVKNLGLAWHSDIDVGGMTYTSPVAAKGVVYFAAGQAVVHAVDGASGKLLWQYDPKVGDVAGTEMRGAWGSRGLAYANGKIFVGTMDGRLIALDAGSGKLLWSTQTTTKGDGRYISGAPWVYKDKVIIGHGGADFVPIRGYVTAYDQNTGKKLWRFFTVPGDPAKGPDGAASDSVMGMAAKTWKGQWWKFGGGGTAWNAMAYDAKFNRIYIGTGNGTPWNQKIRSPGGGDNLFLSSIIAVDADTGKYVWHYQTNPGETWDYNATHDMALADIDIAGQKVPVLLQAPKNGFFYVIDRRNGKPLSATPFVPVSWASKIDLASGRPVEVADARYPNGKTFTLFPSSFGAHGVAGMSFSPSTGMAYIPAMHFSMTYADDPSAKSYKFKDGERFNTGTISPPSKAPAPEPYMALVAINPSTQKIAWQIKSSSVFNLGAIATTAGNLLLQGRGDGLFTIRSATSGKMLWSYQAPSSLTAQPITYRANGRQYVAIVTTSRAPFGNLPGGRPPYDYRTNQMRILGFALDGRDRLPAPDQTVRPILDVPSMRIDPSKAKLGAAIYGDRCAICHGANATNSGMAPNLLKSDIATSQENLKSVLHDGVLTGRGMPKFSELSDADIVAIMSYIRQRARQELAGDHKVNSQSDSGTRQ